MFDLCSVLRCLHLWWLDFFCCFLSRVEMYPKFFSWHQEKAGARNGQYLNCFDWTTNDQLWSYFFWFSGQIILKRQQIVTDELSFCSAKTFLRFETNEVCHTIFLCSRRIACRSDDEWLLICEIIITLYFIKRYWLYFMPESKAHFRLLSQGLSQGWSHKLTMQPLLFIHSISTPLLGSSKISS